MQEPEVVYLNGSHGISRIYPPKPYGKKTLEFLHKKGRRYEAVLKKAKIHYHWPGLKNDVRSHVSSCKICFTNQPSKSETKRRGLSVPIEDLSPMDWLVTDLCEKKDSKG